MINKRQDMMEKVLALVLLAYGMALLVGERLRDALFGGAAEVEQAAARSNPGPLGGANGDGIRASLSC